MAITSESMCKGVLVTRIVKFVQENVVRSTNHLKMTIAVDWEVKNQTKQIHHRFKAEESKIFIGQDKTVNNFLPHPYKCLVCRNVSIFVRATRWQVSF